MEWYNWVCLIKTHRHIYDMTYFDHHVTSKAQLRNLTRSRKWPKLVMLHISPCVSSRQTNWDLPHVSISFISKVMGKNVFWPDDVTMCHNNVRFLSITFDRKEIETWHIKYPHPPPRGVIWVVLLLMQKKRTSRPPMPFWFIKETPPTLLNISWQDELFCQKWTSVAVLQHRVFSIQSIQPRRESFGSAPERGAPRHRPLNDW